jgi:murein DD-endopeptidase MepM/ murein hydrolase activator NlpD
MKNPRRFPRLHLTLIIAIAIIVVFSLPDDIDDVSSPKGSPKVIDIPLNLGKPSTPATQLSPAIPEEPAASKTVETVEPNPIAQSAEVPKPAETQAADVTPVKVIEKPLSIEPQDPTTAPVTAPPVTWEPEYNITTHEHKVQSGDTLTSIFKRYGIPQKTLFNLLDYKGTKPLTRIKTGEEIILQITEDGRFVGLRYAIDPTDTLVVSAEEDKFKIDHEIHNIEYKKRFGQAVIDSSLFLAGEKAGLSHALIMELANMFGWDIDFALDIREGDTFRVLYHEQWVNGRKIKDGPILVAEFINQGDTFQAIRYTDSDGNSNYYTPEGLSMRKAFLRAPLNFTRISSHFNLKRRHPVLHTIRAHRGTDYAAPTGTPVWASGDGKVKFAGWNGGYGKVVVIQHGQKYSTKYAHLSRIKSGIRPGKKIRQGQTIGYVGTTGRSTGPHLHYEFLVNGVHRNSRTIKLPQAEPIAKKEKDAYTRHSKKMMQDLETATRLAAHSNYE